MIRKTILKSIAGAAAISALAVPSAMATTSAQGAGGAQPEMYIDEGCSVNVYRVTWGHLQVYDLRKNGDVVRYKVKRKGDIVTGKHGAKHHLKVGNMWFAQVYLGNAMYRNWGVARAGGLKYVRCY